MLLLTILPFAPQLTRHASAATLRSVTGPGSVDFAQCSEFAGETSIAAAPARDVVPAQFQLAGSGTTAILVVRVAHCAAISIAGGNPQPATLAQVGISIVSPDGTGDITNYTLWYETTSPHLAAYLSAFGIPARLVPDLTYLFIPFDTGTMGPLVILGPARAGDPGFIVNSSATIPTAAPIPFVANWWVCGGASCVKMGTTFPAIQFGSAHSTLITNPANPLGQLIGGATITFPLLDSYNRAPNAHMVISGLAA